MSKFRRSVLSRYFRFVLIGFMLLVMTSLIWNIINVNQQVMQLAGQETKASLMKVRDVPTFSGKTVTLELVNTFKTTSIQNLILTHFLLWIVGFGFLFFLGKRLTKSELSTNINEKKLAILSHALQQSANGIIITNSSGVIEYVNQAFIQINGFTETELIGTTPKKMKSGLNPPELYAEMWSTITQGFTWKGEFKNRKKNGGVYWCFETISPIFDDNNNITHYIGIIEDIQDRKTTEEHIRHLAKFDPLTNLPNRHFFRDELANRIYQAHSNGKFFGLLYIDLDRFKMVNDSLGHTVGDTLLQKLAERFLTINDQMHFFVRLGGDEFAIITAFTDSKKTVETFAQSLHETIKVPFVIEEHDIFMTASIGIALYPQDGDDSESLVKAADMAMYGAKIKGKNTYLFFEPTNGDFASETLIIENGLRKALKNNELFLVYQPKWDTQENRFIGLEVLVRWQSPELGFMNPAQFISIAEETDLIIILGEWILKEALISMMKLSKIIGFIPKISVNLSPVQFRNNTLNGTIKEILEQTLFPPEKLELEITEGALVSNPKMAIEKMNDLIKHGITFSIDDFGTGYSSMSYLKKFPVSTLKIDKSFVDDVVKDPQDRAIIEAVITLAASLNMKTIAEGAETKEQVDILNFIGCYAIQGYWHSRPLNYEDLVSYFQKQSEAVSSHPL